MTEDALNKLSKDALFDMLMKSTKELVDMIHKEGITKLEAKKKEVQLIQKAIIAKRAENNTGSSLL
jgi:hypothetical protein